MADTNLVVVTAATGNIGSKLVRRLLDNKQKVRAVARNKQKLQRLAQEGAEIFAADVLDAPAMARAFAGATAVFTLIPPSPTAPDVRMYYDHVSESYVTAIKNAGVAFVLNLSSIGAHLKEKTGPIMGLRDHEQRLNGVSSLNLLHLRPAFFMENLLMQMDLIRNTGSMMQPFLPDLKFPMIATQDIAAVAAEHLRELDFVDDGVEELLGQRDLSMNDAAKAIGKAIDRLDLKYMQVPYEEVKKAMTGMGLSDNFASSLIEMNRSMNEGFLKPAEARTSSNTTSTSIEEFAQKTFAPAFRQKDAVGTR